MLVDLSSLKVGGSEVARQLFRQNASGLLRGYLRETLRDKSTSEIYDYLLNANIWEEMPPKVKSFLFGCVPWNLDWFTLDWLFKVIDRQNRTAATAIITSPELQQKIKDQIATIKQFLT